MPKFLTKIMIITILCAVVISLSWFVYSINKSNKEIPKRAMLVENINYDVTQGGISYN